MTRIYVESTPEFELQDVLDDVIMNHDRIYDKNKKMYYLKVGCGFDIETSKIPTDHGNVAYCYHWQFGIGEYAIMGRNLNNMESFLKLLWERMDDLKPNTNILVLDANLGYEWQFCKHYWAHLGIKEVFAKERRAPIYIYCGIFMFREVIGLWGRSLDDIASKHCNVRKITGKYDYDKIRISSTEMDETEIAYCERDVEILVQLGEKIFNTYYGKHKRMPFTSTGIVRDEIKKRLGKELKAERRRIELLMPDEMTYELFRLYLFKGGTCGSNIIYMNKTLTNIVGADITSDYPFQMLTKKFPMGKALESTTNEFMQDEKPYIAIIKFFDFKSRNTHALMSVHKALNKVFLMHDEDTVLDNNRIQYCTELELILNDIEYKALEKAYKWKHKVIKKCWKFNDGYDYLPQHIRETVIDWYLKKEKLKSEGKEETTEYKDAKAFVNGIFGMMCTALYMDEFNFQEDECTIDIDTDETGNPIRKDYRECCKYLFLSPYWGFWITSYARAMLWDVICRFPNVIIQYDTDSVYFKDDGSLQSEQLKQYLRHFNRVTSNSNLVRFAGEERLASLGTWDFTDRLPRFKALGAKRYMYEKPNGKIKVVVSGLRNNKNDGRSTLLHMNEYNNRKYGTDVDPFDFFQDGMLIDSKHSEKLASKYIDDYIVVNYNGEILEIPSCTVLEPVEFEMTLGKSHKSLLIAINRFASNSKDRMVYDIWRELKKSSTSTTTQIWESTTIGT